MLSLTYGRFDWANHKKARNRFGNISIPLALQTNYPVVLNLRQFRSRTACVFAHGLPRCFTDLSKSNIGETAPVSAPERSI